MADETAVAVVEKPKTTKGKGVTDLSLSAEQFAKAAVASGLYKDTKSIAEAYIKMTLGASIGVDPATAMNSILLVNGKPSFTANLIAARIKQSGKYRMEVLVKDATQCSIQFYERIDDYNEAGKPIKVWVKPGPPEVFTMKMAETAGLTRNPVWKSFPQNMLFCRALTNGAKTYCADCMVGNPIYTPDELDPDMKMVVDADGDVVPDAKYVVANHSEAKAAEPDRLPEVRSLMERTQTDESQFLNYFKKDSLEKLTASEQAKAVQLLTEKLKALPKT